MTFTAVLEIPAPSLAWRSSWSFFIIVLCLLYPLRADAQASIARELWRGEFRQTSPLPWTGKMELFFRYDAAENFPQNLEGIISWPGLKKAKTKIQGIKTEKSIRFKEVACLGPDCSQVVLGGVYEAIFQDFHTEIVGKASLPALALKGDFTLKRVLNQE